MSSQAEKILEIIEKVAKNNKFISFEHNLSAGSEKGDNFIGEITRVRINGKKADGKEENLSLILKCTVANEARREYFMNDVLFEREVYFYKTVIPKFIEFQRECGLDVDLVFSSYPKCLDTEYISETGEYIIVFEDLCTQGFEMWQRDITSPLENVNLVVRTLAKFHAVSFAMKDQQPQNFEEFKKLSDLLLAFTYLPKGLKMFESRLLKASENLNDPKHKEIYNQILNNLQNYLKDTMDITNKDRFYVVGHGDCNTNNILFSKSKLNKVNDIRILDYQFIRYGSPALDLVYYLFGATNKKLREKDYQNIIKIYYEQLSLNIRSMGSDPEKLFTFDDLQNELKRCGNLAMIMTPIHLQIYLTKTEDIVDLNEISEQEHFSFSSKSEFEIAFRDKLNDVVTDLVNFGYYKQVE